MSLLAILISLAIEHYVDSVTQFRNYNWVMTFSAWVKEKFSETEFWNDTLGLIATILVPVFGCAIIFGALNNAMGLLGFLFSLLVLVYCIGPTRVLHTVRQYIDAAEHEDEHSSQTYVNEILGSETTEITAETHNKICEKLIDSTNEGILSIFFWFILLGPMGAIMCRMVSIMYKNTLENPTDDDAEFAEFNRSTRMLYAILLWLPAQITMLAFAITGSFIDTLQEWKSRLTKDYLDPRETEETLLRTGLSALQINPDDHKCELSTVHDVLGLCWRSVIVWVTALALLTLAGLTG
ncbi:regulatory signaling modulator protein AmpE [Kaarinaea lacus]